MMAVAASNTEHEPRRLRFEAAAKRKFPSVFFESLTGASRSLKTAAGNIRGAEPWGPKPPLLGRTAKSGETKPIPQLLPIITSNRFYFAKPGPRA